MITSSQKGKLSFINKFGNISFTKFLSDFILNGKSLKDAYDSAKNKLVEVGGVYALQVPEISISTSDELLNFKISKDFIDENILSVSIKDYFGKYQSSFDISTTNKNINLFIKIDGSRGVNKIWATVIPPNYQIPIIPEDTFDAPDMTPYTVDLKYDKDSDKYVGTYDKLDAAYEGEYSITYYIEDSDGNIISKNVKLEGNNIDSNLIELKNKPVFELSTTYLEILLNSSGIVSISDLGNYEYNVSSANTNIATASINNKKVIVKALNKGQTNIVVTAKNNGYSTTKEFVVNVKESDSVKKEIIKYEEGWTLVSPKTIDGINPSNISNLKISWKFDGKWLVYTSDNTIKQKMIKAGFESMNIINAGEGSWIKTSSSGTITQVGTPYNILGDNLTNKLHYGWNLIGSGTEVSIKNLYNKIATYGSDIEIIWTYRRGKWYIYTKSLFYIEKIRNSMDVGIIDKINSGEGFWVYIK